MWNISLQNKNRAEQVADAKRTIKKWEEEGQAKLLSETSDNSSIEGTGNPSFDTSHVTSSVLEVMLQVTLHVATSCD